MIKFVHLLSTPWIGFFSSWRMGWIQARYWTGLRCYTGNPRNIRRIIIWEYVEIVVTWIGIGTLWIAIEKCKIKYVGKPVSSRRRMQKLQQVFRHQERTELLLQCKSFGKVFNHHARIPLRRSIGLNVCRILLVFFSYDVQLKLRLLVQTLILLAFRLEIVRVRYDPFKLSKFESVIGEVSWEKREECKIKSKFHFSQPQRH